jgi:RecB family exonuclease
MSEPLIAEIDAAGSENVVSPAPRLVSFACDALRYAADLSDAGARRLAVSPYSGLPRGDACALIVASGPRATFLETVRRERVPLERERLAATHAFARALAELEQAYRAQGATLEELVEAIRLHFDFAGASPRELATFAALRAAARDFDARAGAGWDVEAALAALASVATAPPARPAAPALHPLPAREAEAACSVRRRKTHYSASSLGAYAECPRRWFYRYVCASIEDKGSSASFYGSALHWALEEFHKRYPRADSAPPGQLEAELDRWIQTAFDRYKTGFGTAVELELQRRRARRTGRRYVEWFVERGAHRPFSVVGTETAANLQLEGYDFIGYIDRLDRDDATGALTVLDYKTGTIAESAAEYRKKVAEFLDFQLPFYYWAQTEGGERVSRLALIPLKDPLLDVRPVELEVVPLAAPPARGSNGATTGVIGIDELERARTKMIELARHLADEPIEAFAVARDAAACTYCAYRNACRHRPLRREDRFGR